MEIKDAFKFCPRCGTKGQTKSNHLQCSSCSLSFYANPKACNGLIIKNEDGEILLVERATDPRKGFWDVPGGFLEVGENFEESSLREVKEELGIDIFNLKYIGSFTDNYEFQDVVYPTVAAMFSAQMKIDGQLKPADDVASYKFFKTTELPVEDFAFPWMQKFFSEQF